MVERRGGGEMCWRGEGEVRCGGEEKGICGGEERGRWYSNDGDSASIEVMGICCAWCCLLNI